MAFPRAKRPPNTSLATPSCIPGTTRGSQAFLFLGPGVLDGLERRGYQITLAHSAEQAVEKARTQDFDLLISDIGLPDGSGLELMRQLRARSSISFGPGASQHLSYL